jgi:alkanesulfonate monooxygenase SsuD/methylene tetrahydromethanopterin reductase-like flavin-dependent oxidoreductase (luciferase family)
MRSGLFVPIFDALADPALVARLSAEAEEAGWDGIFLWDHVRWREPVLEVADAWITLAAIATATQAIRLGPMVTPLARRRPVKVARETATLDRLSGGRSASASAATGPGTSFRSQGRNSMTAGAQGCSTRPWRS